MLISRVPTTQIYDLNKIKTHLRVISDDENEYIEDLTEMSISYIEEQISSNIREYKTTLEYENVVNGESLNLARFKSLVSIKSNNVQIPDNGYYMDDNNIVFTSDYEDVEIIYLEDYVSYPFLKHAINLTVANWYENREGQSENLSQNALNRMLGMVGLPIK